jgi:hypothetical protein
MTATQSESTADGKASKPDYATPLLGVASLVAGVAAGLFSDLRSPGQVIGIVTFAAWVIALALIIWSQEESPRRSRGRGMSVVAFALTAGLFVYAFMTGPRLSSRTLVLSPSGVRLVNAACPGAPDGSEVSARVALNQLSEQFIHIELVAPGCDDADKDIRIRSADVQGVLPAP